MAIGFGNLRNFQFRIGKSGKPNCVRYEKESEDLPIQIVFELIIKWFGRERIGILYNDNS